MITNIVSGSILYFYASAQSIKLKDNFDLIYAPVHAESQDAF